MNHAGQIAEALRMIWKRENDAYPIVFHDEPSQNKIDHLKGEEAPFESPKVEHLFLVLVGITILLGNGLFSTTGPTERLLYQPVSDSAKGGRNYLPETGEKRRKRGSEGGGGGGRGQEIRTFRSAKI